MQLKTKLRFVIAVQSTCVVFAIVFGILLFYGIMTQGVWSIVYGLLGFYSCLGTFQICHKLFERLFNRGVECDSER